MGASIVRSPVLAGLADTVLQPGFKGTTLPDWVRKRLSTGLGGIALYSRNLVTSSQIRDLTAAIRAENPEVVIALDEEGGDVTRLEAFTGSSRPGNLALGAAGDPALTCAVAQGIGHDLAAAGISLNYAPVVDIDAEDNPVVGTRAFGSDPELVARHTTAWVTGLQSAGVAACAKHFPGHGATSVDSHDALPVVRLSREELAATALLPYRAAIAAGVRAVMTGHLLVPAYDESEPATTSRRLMVQLLREELGFDGLIVTDGIEMPAVSAPYGLGGATVRALAAGADAICVGGENATPGVVGLLRNAIMAAVADGTLPEERLAEAAARVRALTHWTATHLPMRPHAQAVHLTPPPLTSPQTSLTAPSAPESTVQPPAAPAGPGAPVEPADAPTAAGASPTQSPVTPHLPAALPLAVGYPESAPRNAALLAARRALRVTVHERPTGDGPPHVVELDSPVNLAVDRATPWGLVTPLTRLFPGTTSARLADPEPEDLAKAVDAAEDRLLVVVIRTAYRHTWVTATVDAILARRPGSVVVELGTPGHERPGAVHIATHGATNPCSEAAATAIAHLIRT
ncbi:glycoside hydrolase family 3 N-terminal domain-containing protein [Nonomuraea sp. NPDC023979]|uniref:glycoside hydrolase family 3 protein n=1 Tax=Nonomuraea sp. NPDC023979 TaxID=3154796 RepID=UPI0034080521